MQRETFGKDFFKEVLKGVALYVIGVLVGVLLVALIVRIAVLQANTVKIINQILKTVLMVLSCLFSVKSGLAIVKGALIGAVGTVIVFLMFALFGGQISFGLPFVVDIILTSVTGALSSLIVVTLKR